MRRGIAGLALLVAACGSQSASDDTSSTIRLPLGTASAAVPAPVTPLVPDVPMVWTWAPGARAAWYGPSAAPVMLAISCEGREGRRERLRVVRYVPADKGARAVLAIQGSKGILRLPVDAVKVGKDYAWRGEIDAADPRVEALLGQGMKITVPGGGMLQPTPMGEASAVVSKCGAGAVPPLQTLPNLPSNPAMSPAAR